MTNTLVICAILLLLAVLGILLLLLRRWQPSDLSPMITRLETLDKLQERTERSMKEEAGRHRQESGDQARGLREEIQGSLKISTESLVRSVDLISTAQQRRLEDFASQLNALKQAGDSSASQLRLELTNGLNSFKDSLRKQMNE